MKMTWKSLIALAIIASGFVIVGCNSNADTGPANNGGAEVTEETRSRLKVADDSGGGGQTSDTTQAAPPPTGE